MNKSKLQKFMENYNNFHALDSLRILLNKAAKPEEWTDLPLGIYSRHVIDQAELGIWPFTEVTCKRNLSANAIVLHYIEVLNNPELEDVRQFVQLHHEGYQTTLLLERRTVKLTESIARLNTQSSFFGKHIGVDGVEEQANKRQAKIEATQLQLETLQHELEVIYRKHNP